MFALWNAIIVIVASVVLGIIGSIIQYPGIVYLVYLYDLAVLIPAFAVGARRLHDTNRSGWWLLIGLVPLVGAIVLLVFMIMDGQPGDNKYGPNPKGVGASAQPAATS